MDEHAEIIKNINELPQQEIASYLSNFFPDWPLSKTDLFHWVAPLNRLDAILQSILKSYEIITTLQSGPFNPNDKYLILSIIQFFKILLEHCANKSLFSSYDSVVAFMSSIDMDVLEVVLRFLYNPLSKYTGHKNLKTLMSISLPLLEIIVAKWNFKSFFDCHISEVFERKSLPELTEDGRKFSFFLLKNLLIMILF